MIYGSVDCVRSEQGVKEAVDSHSVFQCISGWWVVVFGKCGACIVLGLLQCLLGQGGPGVKGSVSSLGEKGLVRFNWAV